MITKEDAAHIEAAIRRRFDAFHDGVYGDLHAMVRDGALNREYKTAFDNLAPECTRLTAEVEELKRENAELLIDLSLVRSERDELRARLVKIQSLELSEALAALAHEQWCGWMTYLFKQGTTHDDGSFTIRPWAVERWVRQVGTVYAGLSEQEKQSDRYEAERVLKTIRTMLHSCPSCNGIDPQSCFFNSALEAPGGEGTE